MTKSPNKCQNDIKGLYGTLFAPYKIKAIIRNCYEYKQLHD